MKSYKVRMHWLLFGIFLYLPLFSAMGQGGAMSYTPGDLDGSERSNLYRHFLYNKFNLKSADSLCLAMIKETPELPRPYGMRGKVYEWLQDPKAESGVAAPYYKQLIGHLSSDWTTDEVQLGWFKIASHYLGLYYFNLGEYKTSQLYYSEILKYIPEDGYAKVMLGQTSGLVEETDKVARAQREKLSEQQALKSNPPKTKYAAGAASTSNGNQRSPSNGTYLVRADQAGMPNKVFMCSYCGTTVRKASGTGSPNGVKCSARGTNHQWNELGLAGNNTYACRNCRVTVNLTGAPHGNFRCHSDYGGPHRFEQL